MHVIGICSCNWTYFEPRRLAEVKSHVIKIIFRAEIFNSEISESFAVGDEISVKIMTYGIDCPTFAVGDEISVKIKTYGIDCPTCAVGDEISVKIKTYGIDCPPSTPLPPPPPPQYLPAKIDKKESPWSVYLVVDSLQIRKSWPAATIRIPFA